MSLKKKTLATYQNVIILASIIPIIIFGLLTYNNSKEELTQTTFDHINSINTQKKELLQKYFIDLEFNIKGLAKTISFLEKQAHESILSIQTLQKNNIKDHYSAIENNLISLSKKDIFQYIYSFLKRGKTVDKAYFENIRTYKDSIGLKNIVMLNPSGEILYSSDEESMMHSNIAESSSSWAKTFTQIKNNKNLKEVYFLNFSYEKKSQEYKHYAITRFKDVDGFIAIEINQSDLQKSIRHVESLGTSAETYLVYKDGLETFLATNRNIKPGKIGNKKEGEHVSKGFQSQGIDVKYGSSGDIELVGYMPIKIKNITLSMQTTVSYTDIVSPIIKGADYFEQFAKDYNYRNIMIIDPDGNIFYSVTKEDDYKTNIINGKYAQTHLNEAFTEVLKSKKIVVTDLSPYSTSSKDLAQFILLPIIKNDASIQSVLVIQLKANTLTSMMKQASNAYSSYQTYIVNKDYKLLSDTYLEADLFNTHNSFYKDVHVKTKAVSNALNFGSGTEIIKDYRGVDVLSSFSLYNTTDLKWVVITEIDAIKIENMLSGLKNNIYIFVFISSLFALLIMLFITNEKNRQDKKIYHTATHDSLTGLPNRQSALEFLSFILKKQKRLKSRGAVLFIDLDKFKIINDSYGHKAGDLVLIEIAKRLTQVLREEDLVARLGGDEFIVVLNQFKSLSDLDRLCHKIIGFVSKRIQDEERVYEVGISIGIATFPDDSLNAQELLQFSDTAMFRTKDNGRNGYTFYSKEMTEKSLKISRVESELKYAIQNNELELYYQPQIDLNKSTIIGVEALVRWNHPRDGLIMPNDFIPIAEESNLIIDLGDWVIYEACKSFKKWQDSGINLEYIAVNMSTKQLQSPQCIQNTTRVFQELDFKPQYLELEITENTLISNLEKTISNINTFKKMGIRFSIDDFGTGYSSLAYLKSLRISTLKIDREFIKDIISNQDDRSIVTAIIAMGHAMKYKIVAEGVENKEGIVLLKALKCDIIQGYYYSKPLPQKDLLLYIKNKKWIK